MTAPAVAVDGLWVAYRTRNRWGWRRSGREHWALRDVDLSVQPGASLGVIGGNGSGKTTLLQVVAGVVPPSRGAVRAAGRVASLVELSAGFHRDLTGHENLLIGGVLLGMGRAELRRRYDEIVAFSGLPARSLDAPLSSYSAGMGLRLGFSLVVHTDPDVLLVDEVLAVGDQAFQQRCIERVDQLRGGGCAVLIVSHDLGLVRSHCQDVAVLDDGAVAFLGEPDVAIEQYRQRRELDAREPTPEAQLFEPSWRAQAARRRKGT